MIFADRSSLPSSDAVGSVGFVTVTAFGLHKPVTVIGSLRNRWRKGTKESNKENGH